MQNDNFYSQALDFEAFGHCGLGLGRLHAPAGKNTMAVMDELVAKLVERERADLEAAGRGGIK
jgi:hypothetical protein